MNYIRNFLGCHLKTFNFIVIQKNKVKNNVLLYIVNIIFIFDAWLKFLF